MKILDKADIYLSVLLVAAIIFAIFFKEWDHENRNRITVINNSERTEWIVVTCVPNKFCNYSMKRGEIHTYKNLSELELSYHGSNRRYYYHIEIPSTGKLSIHVKDVFLGKAPEGTKLTCSVAFLADYYHTRYKMPCPIPEDVQQPKPSKQ